MKQTVVKYKSQGGFTMLEIISVLVIMAIIAAVAVSRVSSISQSTLKANAEKLKVHLRYAQLRSLNSTERVWGIDFSGGSYKLFYTIASDTEGSVHYVSFPGGEGNIITLPNTTIAFNDVDLSFDTWGKPYQNLRANFDSSPVQQTQNRTITLTDTSGHTETITITKNTGYIP
jgi:prepilin-type N-terminal cleavage/methylation domain-containing protein